MSLDGGAGGVGKRWRGRERGRLNRRSAVQWHHSIFVRRGGDDNSCHDDDNVVCAVIDDGRDFDDYFENYIAAELDYFLWR